MGYLSLIAGCENCLDLCEDETMKHYRCKRCSIQVDSTGKPLTLSEMTDKASAPDPSDDSFDETVIFGLCCYGKK